VCPFSESVADEQANVIPEDFHSFSIKTHVM